MAAPGFKPLLVAWSRQRAPGLLPCSSPFRRSFWGRDHHPVLFQCSSIADPITEAIKSHNRGVGRFIAAGVSEHTVQDRTNSDAGQNEIPQDDTKFDKLFLITVYRSQSKCFYWFFRGKMN